MQDWIEERYGDQDLFDFYAANVAESDGLVAEYVEEIGLTVPVLLVTQQVNQQYLIRGRNSPFPLDYVIDGDRIIQYAQHEYEPELMLMTIDRLLDMDDNSIPGTDKIKIGGPKGFLLNPAFPNPFNNSTLINFQIETKQNLSLSIFDLSGREMKFMQNTTYNPGGFSLIWQADNMPTGIYYCRLWGDNSSQIQKLVLLR